MMNFEEFKKFVANDKALSQQKIKKITMLKKKLHNERFGELGYFNSIGSTALKVGSVKVSTLNLARIAYESNGSEDKYITLLKDRLVYNLEALDVVRDIIKKNVERGLLPNFNDGMLDFKHLYNTVGVNGIYETMKTFGYTEIDEFGNTKYKPEAFKFGELILKTIQEVNKEFGKYYTFTVGNIKFNNVRGIEEIKVIDKTDNTKKYVMIGKIITNSDKYDLIEGEIYENTKFKS